MKTITPREFRNAFVAVLKAEQESFRTAVGFEAKSYTYFMRSNIFPQIAKHLGLLAWNKEYYALDGMFYGNGARMTSANIRRTPNGSRLPWSTRTSPRKLTKKSTSCKCSTPRSRC